MERKLLNVIIIFILGISIYNPIHSQAEELKKIEVCNSSFKLTKSFCNTNSSTVHLQTVNSENIPLEGVKFKVTGSGYDEIFTTNHNGDIFIDDLKDGNYQIEEIESAENYYNEHFSEKFTINSNNQTVEINDGLPIVNDLLVAKVSLHKSIDNKDNNSDELLNGEGIEYTIWKDNEFAGTNNEKDNLDIPVQSMVTNDKGYAESDWLGAGTYFINETKTIDGYKLDDTVYKVSISQTSVKHNQMIIDLGELIGNINYGYIDVHVFQDFNGHLNNLPDARFAIYQDLNSNEIIDSSENLIQEVITTDFNGYAKSNKLKAGNYILKEISGPENIIINNKNYYAKIVDDSEIVSIEDIINDEITNTIHIEKIDENGEYVENAHLKLINVDTDEIIEEWDTKDGPYNIVLPYGRYQLEQTIIPYGYENDEDDITFEVTENNQEQTIKTHNNRVVDIALTAADTLPIIIFIVMSFGFLLAATVIKMLLKR